MKGSGLFAPWRARTFVPAVFAWDTLAFDSLTPDLVVVTGRFRWVRRGAMDTVTFVYAAIAQPTDSGMVIRMEHETLAPSPRR